MKEYRVVVETWNDQGNRRQDFKQTTLYYGTDQVEARRAYYLSRNEDRYGGPGSTCSETRLLSRELKP